MGNRFTKLLSFLFILISCESGQEKESCSLVENSRSLTDVTKILFIGNSHTNRNSIPNTVKMMAASAGDSTYVNYQVPPGYSFKMHCDRQETMQAIESEKWDFVILQEQGGIQALPIFMADTAIYQYAEILVNAIRENYADTKIILYMTHGYRDGVLTFGDEYWCEQDPFVCNYEGMQERIKENYIEMSNRFNAEVAPAGMIWKIFMDENPDINLFNSDGIHALPAGSYISACSIYSTIFRKSPMGKYVPDGISSDLADTIQKKVYEVLFQCNPDWRQY